MLDDLAHRGEDPLGRDLRLIAAVVFALVVALHGDAGAARALLDSMEATAGDDPYVIAVWAAMAVTIAAMAGDPARAIHVAERGVAADPGASFAFFGGYQRLGRCWARAVTGGDPAGAAAEAQKIVASALVDPPRAGLAHWSGLLGEMWLAAGEWDEAAAALDRADSYLDVHGERYAEGLLILLRARLMQARGEPAAARAAAEHARALSIERGAYLFARRAEELLAGQAEA